VLQSAKIFTDVYGLGTLSVKIIHYFLYWKKYGIGVRIKHITCEKIEFMLG